jgi:hypothetical protein
MGRLSLGLGSLLVIQLHQCKFAPPASFLRHPHSVSNIAGIDLALRHHPSLSCTLKIKTYIDLTALHSRKCKAAPCVIAKHQIRSGDPYGNADIA